MREIEVGRIRDPVEARPPLRTEGEAKSLGRNAGRLGENSAEECPAGDETDAIDEANETRGALLLVGRKKREIARTAGYIRLYGPEPDPRAAAPCRNSERARADPLPTLSPKPFTQKGLVPG
jgi:hypothetical protein